MDYEQMELLYSKIANKINQIIPVNWHKVCLYASVNNNASFIFFYFFPEGSETPVYNLDIPRRYQVNNDEFSKLDYDLSIYFIELQEQFVKNKQTPWTYLFLDLLSSGKFNIEYGYTNMTNISYDVQQMVWEYKTLGFVPDDTHDREVIQEIIQMKRM